MVEIATETRDADAPKPARAPRFLGAGSQFPALFAATGPESVGQWTGVAVLERGLLQAERLDAAEQRPLHSN